MRRRFLVGLAAALGLMIVLKIVPERSGDADRSRVVVPATARWRRRRDATRGRDRHES
jgi:hypothetical protein